MRPAPLNDGKRLIRKSTGRAPVVRNDGVAGRESGHFGPGQRLVLRVCSDSVKVNGEMGLCAGLKAVREQISVSFDM